MKKSILLFSLMSLFLNIESQNAIFDTFNVRLTRSVERKINDMKEVIRQRSYNYNIGKTLVSNLDLDKITGLKINDIIRNKLETKRKLNSLRRPRLQSDINDPCFSPPAFLDNRNIQAPIRNQGECGSCWIFSSIGAYESSHIKTFGTLPADIDASEQHILNCETNGCDGGWPTDALDMLKISKVSTESNQPYVGAKRNCISNFPEGYTACDWNFVSETDADINPSMLSVKKAICKYGSVVSVITATPAFQNYQSGIFEDQTAEPINHAITIVGWDDTKTAWLVRNSWSNAWGENGYAWVKYYTCNIAQYAYWVQAKNDSNFCSSSIQSPSCQIELTNAVNTANIPYFVDREDLKVSMDATSKKVTFTNTAGIELRGSMKWIIQRGSEEIMKVNLDSYPSIQLSDLFDGQTYSIYIKDEKRCNKGKESIVSNVLQFMPNNCE